MRTQEGRTAREEVVALIGRFEGERRSELRRVEEENEALRSENEWLNSSLWD